MRKRNKNVPTILSATSPDIFSAIFYPNFFGFDDRFLEFGNKTIPAQSNHPAIYNYYYGSDYLFIKLGLTKEQFFAQLAKQFEQETNKLNSLNNQSAFQARFLGDSFTESKLLKEQLSSLRKDAMMLDENEQGGEKSGEQKIKSLLDNTASEFSRLKLKLDEVATKGLTQSQINSLEKDIITFEATNLNGMNIIVPKIYLSLKTREELMGGSSSLVHSTEDLMSSSSLLTSSTIFAKGDFTLNSPTASLLNSGSIISGKNMTLNLASLKNKTTDSKPAEIISKNNLTITAVSDIKNLGANLIAKNNLTLTSLKGNILNSSLIQTNDANLLASNSDAYQLRFGDSARTSGNISSRLIETASITAKNISINAQNDFTNLAAKITTTENPLSWTGFATQSNSSVQTGNGNEREDGVTNPVLQGVGGQVKITAGGDINITTLQLRNRTEERGGSKKKSWEKITDSTTNLASEISSSGNISLNSNSDLNIVGSNVAAASDISLTSQNNINILASQNTSFTSESFSKKGFSTSKSSGSGNSSLSNILANLNAENGDIIIASQGDTNIIGAKLNGGSDASITSLGETNISSVTDQNSSYSYANKSSRGLLNHIPVIPKIITAVDNILLGWSSKILNKVSDDGFKKLLSDEKTRVNSSGSNQEIQTTNLTTGNPLSPDGYSATGNLQIQSNKDLNLTSTNLKSENGDITLASNQNINITAAQAISTSSRDEDGKIDHKKSSTEITKTEGRSTSSTLEANNITLTSANDITLQAAKLKAEESVNIIAGNPPSPEGYGRTGNLLILASQDFSTSSETNKSKTTYSKSIGNSGGMDTSVINTEISIPNPIKLKLDAGNLIYAEFNAAEFQSLNYLTALDSAKSILNPLTELHFSYDQTNRNLTQTGQAVVAIAAAAVVVSTAGAGLAAAGATTATAAGATSATVTIAAGAGTVVGASTAASIAAVSATNASMNADGSAINQLKTINKTAFKDTTSKESLQQIAIAATTAALVAGASQATGLTNATNATNAVPSTFERVTTNFATGLQKAGIYSTANILATSAIKGQSINDTIEQQGGGEKIFLNTVINAVAETGAKEIGIAAHTDQISKATQLTLHAGLGATIAAARGSDNTAGILAGAAAAVVGEAAGDAARNSNIDKGAGVAIAQGAGALASLTTSVAMGEGDDDTAKNVGIGASIGANAAANNAYFGERPLQIKLRNGEKIFIPTVTGKILDQRNVELAHEQLFFEDKQGGNLGYFEDNKVKPEDPKLLSLFKPTLTGFDDSLMREAVKNVQPKPYSLLGVESCKYNCQDWSAAVRSEYYHLETQKNLEIWNQLTRPQVNLNQAKQ